MAKITVSINGFGYTVGCDDGQEQHLQAMAKVVEQHTELIRQIGGQSGEGRVLALAGLLMADKLYDMEKYIQSLEKKLDSQKMKNLQQSNKELQEENENLKKTIEDFSERAEAIAQKFKLS